MSSGSQLRTLLTRLGLIGTGVLLSLILSEGLLQTGAWIVRLRTAPEPIWTGTNRHVLCLGDSNTYGLFLERSEAYPAVLQQLWNERPSLGTAEILNLGVPGTNSSKLRSLIDRILWALAPDTVLIMIGANDAWTMPYRSMTRRPRAHNGSGVARGCTARCT
jgi:lysophospholipase L1-like esterase